jgi:hypothetical protein
MKLSRNYLIAALALVILYILYTRPMKSGFDEGKAYKKPTERKNVFDFMKKKSNYDRRM